MLLMMSGRIHNWAKGWLVLLSIVSFVVLVSLPIADPNLISESLDGQFAYTPEHAFNVIASYGEEGRIQMIWIHIADFLLIIVYTLMFCLVISWFFRRGFEHDSKMQKLNLIPLLGGIFDVLENIWIMILIAIYPTQSIVVAWFASFFTTGKYILGVPIILLLLIGLVMALINGFRVYD